MDSSLNIKNSSNHVKFHKSTFEKISEERRQRIMDVAVSEFAANGYNASNINVIAKKADISIGSMYSYFASKEDLFLTIVDSCFNVLETVLYAIDIEEGDIFYNLEKLVRASRDYAKKYPQLNQIYLDVTTQGLAKFSNKLSHKLEAITANLYLEVLKHAQEHKIIDKNIDLKVASFCIDNIIMMFQFSHTSDYYKERMKIFTGCDSIEDEDNIIREIIKFIRKALSSWTTT